MPSILATIRAPSVAGAIGAASVALPIYAPGLDVVATGAPVAASPPGHTCGMLARGVAAPSITGSVGAHSVG